MHRSAWLAVLAIAACSTPAAPPAPIVSTSASAPPPAPSASAPPPRAECVAPEAAGVTLFPSPRVPRAGAPLRVIAISEKPLDAKLTDVNTVGPDTASQERHGGPPYWWYTEDPRPAAGVHEISLRAEGLAACRELTVEADPAPDKTRA